MSQPTGLYGWIQSNDGRSTTLFALFLFAVQIVAAVALFLPLALLDPDHAPFLETIGYVTRYVPFVLIASIMWFGWELFWHVETVKRAVGFNFVDANDEPRLCRILEPLLIMTGLPVPFVGVIDSPARNAFACGIARKKAVIVVTRGLLDSLTDAELAAVLGHELGHIKHGDIRLMAAANIFVSGLKKLHRNNPFRFTPIHLALSIAVPAFLILTVIGGFLGHLAMRMGQVARLVLASSREFIADAEAAQLTKNPAALASALVKVEHDYRVETARPQDDAMMIAGDASGPDATHPTVAQRIAALARTTGSMVFNAPGAPKFGTSASLSEAQAAAILQRLPESRVLPRVTEGARENWLGMTWFHSMMALSTIFALAFIHKEEINNPSAIAAKFDVRPISIMLGGPFACQFSPFSKTMADRCTKNTNLHAYREFEGQKNTLAGLLADTGKQRLKNGEMPSENILQNGGTPHVRKPYTGQSGLLKGVYGWARGNDYFSLPRGKHSSYSADEELQIAEIKGVGCIPAQLNYNKLEGQYSLDGDAGNGNTIGLFVHYAAKSARPPEALGGWTRSDWHISNLPPPPGTDEDVWLRSYLGDRESRILNAYDWWGLAGLKKIQAAYASSEHAIVLARMSKRLLDPKFRKSLKPVELAQMDALSKMPEKFVPCLMLRRMAEAGVKPGL